MSFSREFIDEVKRKTDMVELASEYTTLKQTGIDTWQGPCPHPKHNDDTPSFTVTRKKQYWTCFGCNTTDKTRDCISFMQWVTEGKMSWREAILYLAKRAGVPVPDDENDKAYRSNKLLMERYERNFNQECYDYLKSRGMNYHDVKRWHIGYDSDLNRIVFPLLDNYDRVIAFNKRVISDTIKSSKYINSRNSEIFTKSTYLYGINSINKDYKYIYITEGVMDVILARHYGLQNVVCTLGCALTDKHYDLIKKTGLKPVLIFDGDNAGSEGAARALELIHSRNGYGLIVKLPNGKDLADVSNELGDGLVEYINNNIMTYSYYCAADIIQEYNRRLSEIKASIRPEVEDIISKAPECERKDILSLLREELKIYIGGA